MIEGLSGELDAKMAERMAEYQRKQAEKAATRKVFKERRDHGLEARHAAKLARNEEARR